MENGFLPWRNLRVPVEKLERGVCVDVPAKRGRSQDTARQACRMRKIMVILPITRSVAQNRFRGGGGKVEGSRERV